MPLYVTISVCIISSPEKVWSGTDTIGRRLAVKGHKPNLLSDNYYSAHYYFIRAEKAQLRWRHPNLKYFPIVAFKNGGTAVHDFQGPYLTQNYDLPWQYAYQWVCLELLYPVVAFISAHLKIFYFRWTPYFHVSERLQQGYLTVFTS